MNPQLIPGVSRETRAKLDAFAELFLKWAKTINLVAPSTKDDVWSRHIGDSAQIFSLAPKPGTWVDLGSGGGFPGIITAILLNEYASGWVHLVESNQKKAAFLRVALASTGARGTVHAVRIEEAAKIIPSCDFISARALADLDLLLDYASPWMLGRESTAFFHKGRDYEAEVAKAHSGWQFDLIKHRSAIQADSVILEINHLQRKTP